MQKCVLRDNFLGFFFRECWQLFRGESIRAAGPGLSRMHPKKELNISGQSIPILHSGPFSHLRCGNGSQTYLNLYICI